MKKHILALIFVILVFLGVACNTLQTTPTVVPANEPSVTVTNDIVYAISLQPDVSEQRLDVYAPKDAGDWPVVIFIHGSGGTKEGYIKESTALAEHGVVVFTPNWSEIIPDIAARDNGKGFREMHDVLSCAIRFARNNATEYGGDASRLTLIGHSYGATLGSWIALSGDNIDDSWEEFSNVRGGPPSQAECVEKDASIAVDAFIGIAGRYTLSSSLQESDPELWNVVNPSSQVERGPMLPIRLLHGERDTTVSPDFSAQMKDILLASDYDVELILYNGTHQVPSDLTVETFIDLTDQ
jgi:predicted esterase